MHPLLSKVDSPRDLAQFSTSELEALAAEMRDVLCNLAQTGPRTSPRTWASSSFASPCTRRSISAATG
jgi:hypothetical protein